MEAARRHLAAGVHAEHTLGGLISQVAVPVTRTAQQAEPMRQWDDIRATTGFLDWLAELGVNADSVREAATRAYNQADEAFGRARSVEQAARDTCLAELKAAYEALPDFRGGDFTDAAVLARSIDPLLKEITQAGNDPASQLPGSGAKADGFPGAAAAATEAVRAVAEHDWSPIPPENLPWRLGGDRDETSYGPMAVQIRRGAEALGYDPANLSDRQRDEVRSALQDPAQNIFVAAKHLSDLKAETGFAHVPADEMTVGHYAELAARYNGGPHWQETQAQDYGRYVAEHRHTVQEVLR
ncbi:MAG TPA: hypothetical protein VHH34_00560 [Pseudonocardiaceae bacterium]|nr:hypothetical protein [Pseudonocardiaceae bacterium]